MNENREAGYQKNCTQPMEIKIIPLKNHQNHQLKLYFSITLYTGNPTVFDLMVKIQLNNSTTASSFCSVPFTISINIERRRAWLQSAGFYQRVVNMFCVFFCGGDKEMGDGPALTVRPSQVTGLSLRCRHHQISCKFAHRFSTMLYFPCVSLNREKILYLLSACILQSKHVALEQAEK